MVLEMKRSLEEIKSGSNQGYKRLYDATYEEVYCRGLMIIQKEDQTLEFIQDFYKDLFGALDEADDAVDIRRWFLHRFYQKLRKHYHRLLGKQEKNTEAKKDVENTMAEMLAAFPLLHRIMLVMSCKDDFTAAGISAVYGLTEEKIQTELEKLKKMLPTLAKDRPENESMYLESWKMVLLCACEQIADAGSGQWTESLFTEAAKAAGVSLETGEKKSENFEYFVAEPELEPAPEKPKKKVVPVMEEEPEEEEDNYDEDDEYDDDEDDDDEYDDDEDDDDEDDDHYDWDVEEDGKRMLILGIILAVIIVTVIGFAAFRLLGDKENEAEEPVQTEQDVEDNEDKLIVKGGEDGSTFGEEEPVEAPEEEPVEEPEEAPEEEPEEVESEPVIMRVKPSSMRVRSEPNTECEVVVSVKAGDKLEVIGEASSDGWVQVRCIDQDGKEGYAKLENLASE